MAAAFPWLLREWPALLVAHDIGHRAATARARTAGFLRGALHRRDAGLLRASEREALEAARFVWCLADEDRTGFGVDIADKFGPPCLCWVPGDPGSNGMTPQP